VISSDLDLCQGHSKSNQLAPGLCPTIPFHKMSLKLISSFFSNAFSRQANRLTQGSEVIRLQSTSFIDVGLASLSFARSTKFSHCEDFEKTMPTVLLIKQKDQENIRSQRNVRLRDCSGT